jgi:hypothetical protein
VPIFSRLSFFLPHVANRIILLRNQRTGYRCKDYTNADVSGGWNKAITFPWKKDYEEDDFGTDKGDEGMKNIKKEANRLCAA